jgi:RND family efflux transporter MFP subunit
MNASDSSTRVPRHLRAYGLAALVVAIAAAGIGITIRAHSHAALRQWTDAQAIPSVELISSTRSQGDQHLTLPGNVQAYIDAPIYARVSGYLKHWDVDIGAKVKAGDLLAEIETPEIDQQLQQAQADLRTAEAKTRLAALSAKRWTHLLESESVSKQDADEKASDYEARQAEVAAAKANVDRLKALESFKRIVAPFDGIVTARRTDIGDLIDAGGGSRPELFRIADTHKLRIYVQVPQTYASQLERGMKAQLQLPEQPGKDYPASVVETADAISAGSRTLLVQLQADNADNRLLSGSYADVRFDLPAGAQIVQVPISALIFREQGLEVATVDAKRRVVMKPIVAGRDFGTAIEVLSGLEASDRIIDSPPDSLAAGDQVDVVPAAAATAEAAMDKAAKA